LADCQPNARARIVAAAVQPLEKPEYGRAVLRTDSYAIILYGKTPKSIRLLSRDLYVWRFGAAILDRVTY